MTCPTGLACDQAPFIAVVALDMTIGLWLMFYVLYEYCAKRITESRWSARFYAPHEISKHDKRLDSMRPVREEMLGQVMTAKEYVYRYRHLIGDHNYRKVPLALALCPPPPPAPLPLALSLQVQQWQTQSAKVGQSVQRYQRAQDADFGGHRTTCLAPTPTPSRSTPPPLPLPVLVSLPPPPPRHPFPPPPPPPPTLLLRRK